ncbi:hypothetical protein X801_08459, partial [Opisthorchis viverrini]
MTKKKPPSGRPVSANPAQGNEDESIYLKLSDIPYDLMRFNISMKKGVDRREARKALLLRMGAAPPKKQFINYKQLMRDKAESKAKAALLPVDTASTTVNKQVPLNKIKRKKRQKTKGKQSGSKVART